MSSPSSFFKKIFICFSFVSIGYFCVWLIHASLNPPFPSMGATPQLYSNQSQQDLRLIYVNAIRKAQQSIHLVMFGLSDVAILQALSECRMPLTIYYDANESFFLRHRLKNADLHPVHRSGLMHQKVLILDRNLVFIGSANMTESSLRMHDNLVVGMQSCEVAEFLMNRIPSKGGYLHSQVGGQDIELWLLPDPSGQALADLKRSLRSAHRQIKIALFTFTHPDLCDELITAQKRGVEVKVVIDQHSGFGASAKIVDKLRKNGIPVRLSQGAQLLHHKFVWIDDETLICGSTNWTRAAFNKNSDLLLALHQLTQDQKERMRQLWHRTEVESKEQSKIEREPLRAEIL